MPKVRGAKGQSYYTQEIKEAVRERLKIATVAEVAKEFEISKAAIYSWLNRGFKDCGGCLKKEKWIHHSPD